MGASYAYACARACVCAPPLSCFVYVLGLAFLVPALVGFRSTPVLLPFMLCWDYAPTYIRRLLLCIRCSLSPKQYFPILRLRPHTPCTSPYPAPTLMVVVLFRVWLSLLLPISSSHDHLISSLVSTLLCSVCLFVSYVLLRGMTVSVVVSFTKLSMPSCCKFSLSSETRIQMSSHRGVGCRPGS